MSRVFEERLDDVVSFQFFLSIFFPFGAEKGRRVRIFSARRRVSRAGEVGDRQPRWGAGCERVRGSLAAAAAAAVDPEVVFAI